jgi:hypothetical protein
MNLWDFFVWLFWLYVFFACIWIFISVFIDIFRDDTLNGWGKALWVIFLVILPFLAAFIYLIARGRDMTRRNLERAGRAQADNADYIRTVAGSSSATSEIEKGKQLLDAGTITQAEFDTLKAKALQGS